MKPRLALATLAAVLLAAGCFLFPRPPNVPEPPAGPGWALIGETGEYSAVAADRDSGAVSCRLDWGDGDVSNWSAWVPSGTPVAFSRAWPAPGSHAVRARARNSRGEASDWSDSLLVAVLDTPGVPSVVQRRFPLGSTPRQLVLNPDGTMLFLLGVGSNANLLYTLGTDGTGDLVRKVIPVDFGSFDLPAAHGHLYTVSGDRWDAVLADLSLPDFDVLNTLPLLHAQTAVPPVVLPGDSLLCLAKEDALLVIRTSDLLKADSIHIGYCLSPEELVLDPATSEVFIISDCVGFVHRLDPLIGRILATLSTHGESRSLTMPPAGNLVYATNRRRDTLLTIRKEDLVVLAEHPLDCAARAITFAPSGNHYCVVTTEDTVTVRRTADHSVVRQLGETSTLPVIFSRDGLRAWVTNDSELVELGFPPRDGN